MGDNGDVRFVMTKLCIVMGLHYQVVSCIEGKQRACQVPFVGLALGVYIYGMELSPDTPVLFSDFWQTHLGI